MMKCLLINLIVFVIVVNSETIKRLFLPQLPVGDYRIHFLAMISCPSIPNYSKNQFNFYLSKKSASTTEIMGNITILEPFDDSLNLEFNMAVKDLIGGWKENAHMYKSTKACSALKRIFGNAWKPIMEGVGINNATCPIPAGFYKVSSIDTAVFRSTNFPKSFFYGTYRFRIHFTKHKEFSYGCFTAVVELKRPWETD